MDVVVQEMGKTVKDNSIKLSHESEKRAKFEVSLNDHMDLIDSLNKKIDGQELIMDEQKSLLIEKLGVFE
jgi:hypothetical protein